MDEEEELNTAVAKLISMLENKLIRAFNLNIIRTTSLNTETVRAAILEMGVQTSYQHMCYCTGVDDYLDMNNYSNRFPYYLNADAQHNEKDDFSIKCLI
jgi:hypothetical protein